jgi:hypothetical protein
VSGENRGHRLMPTSPVRNRNFPEILHFSI